MNSSNLNLNLVLTYVECGSGLMVMTVKFKTLLPIDGRAGVLSSLIKELL